MNLEKERDKAMKKAREACKSGKAFIVQCWINRADSFAPVSKRRIDNLQKLLDEVRGR